MRRFALTSWSLHHSLGAPAITAEPAETHAIADEQFKEQPVLSLLELPAQLKAAGIYTLELCHFHFPRTTPEYLAQLRAAIEDAGIELFTVLIDAGDITQSDPVKRAADIKMIESWMDVAAAVGAQGVRIVAGNADPGDRAALDLAIQGLDRLAEYGRARNLRVRTENFKPLASTSVNCIRILDRLEGEVGLCADIGNFPAAVRVPEFTAIAGRAEVVHTKASYDADGNIDPAQLHECLAASVAAGFDGPYTLVYDRPGDEWTGIKQLQAVVAPYVG